ncbi:MAG TPA: hypothetical protein VFT22_31215 [Kofleriaceae bacterium]|nr:hypothetical protein [Kofleriaceae bacterium]
MMKTVKHTFSSFGDRSGELARSFGSGTADFARRVGDGTTTLAKRIGPQRALVGFAIAAVAIGGSILLIRYLRARNAEEMAGEEAGEQLGRNNGSRRARRSRQADLGMSG